MGSQGDVTFTLHPKPEALDVLRAWEKKNEDLGRNSMHSMCTIKISKNLP